MRLVYFSREYTPHDHRFLSALAQTEHQVFFLCLEGRSTPLEDRALPAEIEIVNWEGGKSAARLQDGPRLLRSLKHLIRAVKPDLILAGPIQRSALLVALSGFQPLVSMSWGYDLLIDARRNALWEWATRYALKRSAAMVGDCETIRQLAVSYGMPAERIITFPWGVDLTHFSPRQRQASASSAERFTLLSTRAWEPLYGVELIAQAFARAADRCPELRLIMLGSGSQAGAIRRILANHDRQLSEFKNPADESARVIFPGQVSFQNLPRFYHWSDVYVSASHSDGSSISLLEAMACGKPAIVSDIPGNREWVQEGVNGWLFPDGDGEALQRAILQAFEQQRRLAEMGRAARAIAEARADWQKNFPNLFRAFAIAQNPG
ncbi:MAG: hypothetical protein B6D39_05765 [Anaerolineae bacterium UTCFX2]|jgi:glycosyltransferase involved in cell wall biosynthesis|nr:glycosyltransferase family 4 protein [Anaerolineales bacterium]OQY91874.1 MAG: hypothetical protein B6D39_05765 [Anaerolineae bacterium UTCFX2]